MIDRKIQELTTDIYRIKMEINFNHRDLSAQTVQKLTDERMDMKKELRRLMKVKDRRAKITKIRQKI